MMRGRLTRKRPRFGGGSWLLLVILAILGVSIWVMTPSGTSVLHREKENLGLRLGLDLQGGTHVVYRGVFSENTSDAEKKFDMEAAIKSIKKRVDSMGVVEPVIRKLGSDQIDIQLPGLGVEDTLNLLQKTAFLEFREVEMNGTSTVSLNDYISGNRTAFFETGDAGAAGAPTINRLFVDSAGQPAVFIEKGASGLMYLDASGSQIDPATIGSDLKSSLSWMPAVGTLDGATQVLTGAYLTKAVPEAPSQNSTSGEISVGITWDSDGEKLFNEAALRIKNKGSLGTSQRCLGIFLDDELLSAPQVFPSTMTESSYGDSATITGDFTWKEARTLAVQLTSGSLRMPLEITYGPMSVSATLGADFTQKAFISILVGVLVVGLFMMLYYRLPGVVAAVALIIYTVIVLAIYKAIPVTLTLAGIAGFIVSLGMAVDANVLIFERMKEELSAGRTMKAAIDVGFSRAWPAIRDSNITTFIACGILYWFGSSIPTATVVMGFSVTLFIGVAVSMFSAIVVSKTLLLLLAGRGFAKRLALFGVEAKAEAKDA
jgi:protein-export membrane protein SecD